MFHRYWSTPGFLFCLQPDTVTGDIVFVLQQKEHPKFKRKGDDIFYEHTLSLTEALCGFQFILTHLDGRQLLIKSQPGEVVKPGKRHITILCVPSLNNMSYYYFFLVRVFFFKIIFWVSGCPKTLNHLNIPGYTSCYEPSLSHGCLWRMFLSCFRLDPGHCWVF